MHSRDVLVSPPPFCDPDALCLDYRAVRRRPRREPTPSDLPIAEAAQRRRARRRRARARGAAGRAARRPAFAVQLRRRQRELGLVGASGGDAAALRRTVLASGVVLGVVGAALGVALGWARRLAPRRAPRLPCRWSQDGGIAAGGPAAAVVRRGGRRWSASSAPIDRGADPGRHRRSRRRRRHPPRAPPAAAGAHPHARCSACCSALSGSRCCSYGRGVGGFTTDPLILGIGVDRRRARPGAWSCRGSCVQLGRARPVPAADAAPRRARRRPAPAAHDGRRRAPSRPRRPRPSPIVRLGRLVERLQVDVSGTPYVAGLAARHRSRRRTTRTASQRPAGATDAAPRRRGGALPARPPSRCSTWPALAGPGHRETGLRRRSTASSPTVGGRDGHGRALQLRADRRPLRATGRRHPADGCPRRLGGRSTTPTHLATAARSARAASTTRVATLRPEARCSLVRSQTGRRLAADAAGRPAPLTASIDQTFGPSWPAPRGRGDHRHDAGAGARRARGAGPGSPLGRVAVRPSPASVVVVEPSSADPPTAPPWPTRSRIGLAKERASATPSRTRRTSARLPSGVTLAVAAAVPALAVALLAGLMVTALALADGRSDLVHARLRGCAGRGATADGGLLGRLRARSLGCVAGACCRGSCVAQLLRRPLAARSGSRRLRGAMAS